MSDIRLFEGMYSGELRRLKPDPVPDDYGAPVGHNGALSSDFTSFFDPMNTLAPQGPCGGHTELGFSLPETVAWWLESLYLH